MHTGTYRWGTQGVNSTPFCASTQILALEHTKCGQPVSFWKTDMYLAIAVTFLANELIFIVFPFIKRALYKDALAGMCVCVVGWSKPTNPLPFYEPFLTDWQKKYPFCIPSIIASLELCIPFNCCKLNALFLKQWINLKMRERFSRIFLSQKMNLLAFLSLLTNQNGRFPYSFISEIPTLSQIHIAEVRKSYPFRSDLLVYVIMRSTPTGMYYT